MARLELREVVAGYGAITVLHGLSLSIDAGEVVTVLGANGSGKSTALKTVMGLTRVGGGQVAFDGRDVTPLATHRRAALGLGYVTQTQGVFADLTVADNLRMGAWLGPRRWTTGAAEVMELFPVLADRKLQPAGALSGGERRMLAIAMTLLLRPRMLLLDEPSSDLAPATVDLVFEAIRRIHTERGLPVLLVEQNVAKAIGLAHRAVVLVRGRAVLDVPVARLDLGHLHRLFLEGAVP